MNAGPARTAPSPCSIVTFPRTRSPITSVILNSWKEHPDVAQFVKNMDLTNDAQAGMLMAIDVEGRDIVEVVTEWMAANEATWKPWLP